MILFQIRISGRFYLKIILMGGGFLIYLLQLSIIFILKFTVLQMNIFY